MAVEKIIILEDIGEISLKRDRRFKRLSIRMAPNKGIWINVPYGISFDEGIEFARENKNWIQQSKRKKEQKEGQQTTFTPSSEFKTKYHRLRIVPRQINNFSARLSDGVLEVNYPQNMVVENDQLQRFIKDSVIETLKREANYYLPRRVAELAQKHGFSYRSVKVKNTKSRWGSCSHDNNINLNLHLIRLPEELSDMVILHELCHTKVKNHSAEFWNLLGQYCPNLNKKKSELKNYSTQIF